MNEQINIGEAMPTLPGSRSSVGRVQTMLDAHPGQWVVLREGVSPALAYHYKRTQWAMAGGYEFATRTIDGTRWLFGRKPVSD